MEHVHEYERLIHEVHFRILVHQDEMNRMVFVSIQDYTRKDII